MRPNRGVWWGEMTGKDPGAGPHFFQLAVASEVCFGRALGWKGLPGRPRRWAARRSSSLRLAARTWRIDSPRGPQHRDIRPRGRNLKSAWRWENVASGSSSCRATHRPRTIVSVHSKSHVSRLSKTRGLYEQPSSWSALRWGEKARWQVGQWKAGSANVTVPSRVWSGRSLDGSVESPKTLQVRQLWGGWKCSGWLTPLLFDLEGTVRMTACNNAGWSSPVALITSRSSVRIWPPPLFVSPVEATS